MDGLKTSFGMLAVVLVSWLTPADLATIVSGEELLSASAPVVSIQQPFSFSTSFSNKRDQLVISSSPFMRLSCEDAYDCGQHTGPVAKRVKSRHCCDSKKGVSFACLNLCCKQGFWVRAESLLWWSKSEGIPPLATSSTLGTQVDDVGVLGLPTTSILFNDSLFGDVRPGGRIRFGWWADECHYGLDGSFWGLSNDRDESVWSSSGDPAYARPFFNVDPLVNAPDAQLISYDGALDGTLRIHTSSDIVGGDVGIRKSIYRCSSDKHCTSIRLDCYAGYRYFKVREGIRIHEALESTSVVGPAVLGTTFELFDDFQTRNEFHGANFGMVASRQSGRWSAQATSRIAIGNIAREARIDGRTTVTVPNLSPVARAGGLLAQPTNIGVYRDDDLAVATELQLNLLYNIRCNMRMSLGYTFMYLGEIIRPGDIIDPAVNGLQLDPTLPLSSPERPRFAWEDNRMWLMGLNLGLEYNF